MKQNSKQKFIIYYLDDEPELCEVFEELFSSDEIKINTFTDINLFKTETNINPPDVIFIDYRLPGINGDQISKEINNQIPKILVTGEVNIQSNYPFLHKFSKPYDVDKLKTFINTLKKDRDNLKLLETEK